MPKVRPLEVKAILPLLQRDWPDEYNVHGELLPGVEQLAEALIIELDKVRASRTSYVAAVRMGAFVFGVGVYPGERSAHKAVIKQLQTYGNLVSGGAVIPIETPEQFEARIKALDNPPERKPA